MNGTTSTPVPCFCVGDCWPDGPCETETGGACFACQENCHSCRGKGTVALHGIAIAAGDFNGPDWDDDSREAYLSGDYDTPCEICNGKGYLPRGAEQARHEDRALYRAESGMMPGRDY